LFTLFCVTHCLLLTSSYTTQQYLAPVGSVIPHLAASVGFEISSCANHIIWSWRTATHTYNRLTAFGPRLLGWAGTRRNTHPSCVQFTCLTVLFDNLSPGPLWSSSWSWSLYFILHAFLHPIIIFSQHMPIFCCNTNAMSCIPSLSLSSLLGSLSELNAKHPPEVENS